MNKLISKVIGVWRGADGTLGEVTYDSHDGMGKGWEAVDVLIRPIREIQIVCVLEDGARVVFPFMDIAAILPDRTGVLVVFSGNYKSEMQFAEPDNAAIFNADGTLRFRLENPWREHHGVFRGVQHIDKIGGGRELGVRVCPGPGLPCDDVIVVDGRTPDLRKERCIWMRE
jgi:hypothetical protein